MSLSSKMQYEDSLAEMVEAVSPKKVALQNKTVGNVVNRSGGLNRESVLGFLPTQVHEWTPATAAGKYVPQVSRIIGLMAHASTPPSTGNCTVTLTMIAPGSGSATIGTVTIINGQSTGESLLSHIAPAGSWLFASVTGGANGASGVSIAATRRLL